MMSHRKKIWFGVLAALLAVLVAISAYVLAGPTDYTVDDLTILDENANYVEIAYQGKTGKLYKHFAFNFDNPNLLEWFGDASWSAMTLLSPATKTVTEYIALQKSIRKGEADFIDNRIDAVDGMARFTSVAPAKRMVTAKAMLQNDQLWFVKGDDLWFRGRFFLQSGVPFTIVDFQERGRTHSPGPRITIWDGTHIGMELKYFGKPTMRQKVAKVPKGRWFELKLHMMLDDKEGLIRVWQDGELIIDGSMQTLPQANSLLNSLEVGITATDQAAVLLLDDIVISHQPL